MPKESPGRVSTLPGTCRHRQLVLADQGNMECIVVMSILATGSLLPVGTLIDSPRIGRRVRIVFLVVILLGALLAVWRGARSLEARSQRDWPVVTGRVVASRLGAGLNYRPEVVFRYGVGDRQYTDTSSLHAPGFGGTRDRLDVAEKLLRDHPANAAVSVYYDPSVPERSTLLPGPTWDLYVQTGLGLSLLVVVGWG